jgi:putative copper export protein
MEGFGYEWLAKALVYGFLQIAIGLAVARALARQSLRSEPDLMSALDRWLATSALAVAGLLVAAHTLRAWAHTALAFGIPDSFTRENLSLITLESRWGESWRLQAYAAVGVLAAAAALRAGGAAWALYSAIVVATAAAIPLLGHAAGSVSRHLIHTGHLIAGGAWLGTLAVLVALRWRAGRGDAWARASALPLVEAFSPIALASAAVVGTTGVIATWLYVGNVSNLLATGYGRALSFKLACVLVILVCGRANWRRARAGLDPKLPVMLAELAAAATVVLATGVLTETEQP